MVHRSVQVGNRPGLGGRFIQMTWDEMQMKVLRPLSKGDGVHALASGDLLHEITGIAYSASPVGGFCLGEIHGAGTVTQ